MRCVGRRADDHQCRNSAIDAPAGIPVCQLHRDLLAEFFGGRVEVRMVPADDRAVVYYLGDRPSQTVKIGTTTTLDGRLTAIRARHPDVQLLALEPGHFAVERTRHREFKHLRVRRRGESEWFTKADDLMRHINEVRRRHGALLLAHAPSTRSVVMGAEISRTDTRGGAR